MGNKVLVTGASGFIAGHCILDLLSHGYEVRGSVRNLARVKQIREMLGRYSDRAASVEFVEANLLDADSWLRAIDGCDSVMHVASPVPVVQPKDPNEVIRPAKEGAINVLSAARTMGIKRVVMTSSVAAVYTTGRREGVYTAEDWTNLSDSHMTAYSRSKTEAEQAAWAFVEDGGGPELVTVNPALVLGPALEADYGSSLEVLVKLMSGKFPLLPRLGVNIVDVRDVATLHRLALEVEGAAGHRFLCGDEFMWLTEVAECVREYLPAFRSRISTRTMPDFLVRFVALFVKELEGFVNDIGKSKLIDSSPARAIGWQPRSAKVAICDGAQSLVDLGIARA